MRTSLRRGRTGGQSFDLVQCGTEVGRRLGAAGQVYTSSYVDTAIAAARTYAYRIQAFGSSNASSPFSNSDVATTTSLPQVNAGDTIAARA